MDKMTEQDSQDSSTRPVSPTEPPPGDMRRRLDEQAAEITRLEDELRQHREDARNLELSLVTRIADVDDDRRHAATRLQRTQQAHREELDERLKRHVTLTLIVLLLFGLVIASTLSFFFFRLDASRDALMAQMNAVKRVVEQAELLQVQAPVQDSATTEKIDQLSKAVHALSESLARLGNDTPQTSPPPSSVQPTPDAAAMSTEAASIAETDTPATSLDEGATTAAAEAPAASGSESDETPDASSEPPTPTVEPEGSLDIEIDQEHAEPPAATPEPQADMETPSSAALEPEPSAAAPQDANAEALATASEPSPPAESLATNEAAMAEAPSPAEDADSILISDKPFTVQLMGFNTLESLKRFAERHAWDGEYFYHRDTYRGRPWFVLIHSLHESQEAAEASLATLPPDLAKLNIWVRKLDAGKPLTRVGKTPN